MSGPTSAADISAVPSACAPPNSTPGQLTLTGLGYGPYHKGQDPNFNVFPSSEEVTADIPTLAAITRYIRIYSAGGPASAITNAASHAHVCVALGIWLGRNAAANVKEIAAGEHLANTSPNVRSVIVGNEVLLRGDLRPSQLNAVIRHVRSTVRPAVQISMADDYNQWLAHPRLAQNVDFITVHIYPFWQGVPIDQAIQALTKAYKRVRNAFPGKQIVIGETGWPSAGKATGDAVPSPDNQARYLQEFVKWAGQNNVTYFYFDAFDESWKRGERGVGTNWGLYDEAGTLKPALSGLLPDAAALTLTERSYLDVYVGGLEVGFGLGIDTSNQQRHWLTVNRSGLRLHYPAGQAWGTMFITVGQPVPPGNRPSIELSAYSDLVVSMRAEGAPGCLRLGVKDRNEGDNGQEPTVRECVTTAWSTRRIPLGSFAPTDVSQAYVVFEVVFNGASAGTIDIGSIRYAPG